MAWVRGDCASPKEVGTKRNKFGKIIFDVVVVVVAVALDFLALIRENMERFRFI